MNKYIAIFPVIVLLLLSSPTVSALAVSEVELHSYLNQQLDARVYLKNVDKAELTTLKIAIRDVLDEGEGMANLHYEVLENAQGHYISITSEDVIREPVMRFMLELNWSKGRLIREYALIIDPQ
jgi:pilus assembly protein FimV